MTSSNSRLSNESEQKVLKCRNPEWHLVFILYASEHVRLPSGAVLTQECVYLIKSSTASDAYKESLKWASPRQNVPFGHNEFIELPIVGITEVMPVWEALENGSELGYRDGKRESWIEITGSILSYEDVCE